MKWRGQKNGLFSRIKSLLLRSLIAILGLWLTGIFGVQAAAMHFFNKPANRLTASEAALLAAVLPNPIRFRVDAPSSYVRQRQQWILRQMSQMGGDDFLRANGLR